MSTTSVLSLKGDVEMINRSSHAATIRLRYDLSLMPSNSQVVARLDEIIRAYEEELQETPPRTPMTVSDIDMEIKKQMLKNYQQDHSLMIEKQNPLRAKCYTERAQRGLAHQQMKVGKAQEKGLKIANERAQIELELIKLQLVGPRLKEIEARLAEAEAKLPRAEAALKLIEDKINAKSKELHRNTRPLKPFKRESQLEQSKKEAVQAGVQLDPEGPLKASIAEVAVKEGQQ